MIKYLGELRIEGNFLKLIKGIYKKPTAKSILNSESLIAFPLRLETRQGRSLSSLLLSMVLEVPVMAVRQEK